MLMIVLCHIIGYYTFIPGHGFLNEVFNVGVYTFLAISGWLYGTKTIAHFGSWFRARCLTLLLPALILNAAVLTADFLAGMRHDLLSSTIHLLNLHGLGFLWPGLYRYFHEIPVLGPLWFLTVIMLCYCMIPLLQRLRSRLPQGAKGCFAAFAATAAAFGLYVLAGLNAVYFLTFLFGYALAANRRLPLRGRAFLGTTVLMFAALVLRLVLRAVCDGTALYRSCVQVSHMIFGLWILCCFFWLFHKLPAAMTAIAESRAMIYADGISFYVYLTHCCFCRGPLNLYELTDDLLLATAGFAAAVLLSAVILKQIVKLVHRAIGVLA
jgi:peptidoglycan/LPS O-acetylase OafA/YrhL